MEGKTCLANRDTMRKRGTQPTAESPKNPATRRAGEGGFTLSELLIVLVLVSIAASMAMLGLQSAMVSARLDSSVEGIAFNLHLARMKAIAKNTRVRVVFDTQANNYSIERDVAGAWQPEGPAKRFPQGVDLVEAGSPEFDSTGRTAVGVSIVLRNSDGSSKSVLVSRAGRVKVM